MANSPFSAGQEVTFSHPLVGLLVVVVVGFGVVVVVVVVVVVTLHLAFSGQSHTCSSALKWRLAGHFLW
jgi:hypothetical protein